MSVPKILIKNSLAEKIEGCLESGISVPAVYSEALVKQNRIMIQELENIVNFLAPNSFHFRRDADMSCQAALKAVEKISKQAIRSGK